MSQTKTSPARSVPCYDINGNLLFQHSMDAGDRWQLMDAAGKTAFAWDFNQRQDDTGAVVDEERLLSTRYDALHRPIEQWLAINGTASLIERFVYGEELQNVDDAKSRNLRGQLHQHFDASGLTEIERHDLKATSSNRDARLRANTKSQSSTGKGICDRTTRARNIYQNH